MRLRAVSFSCKNRQRERERGEETEEVLYFMILMLLMIMMILVLCCDVLCSGQGGFKHFFLPLAIVRSVVFWLHLCYACSIRSSRCVRKRNEMKWNKEINITETKNPPKEYTHIQLRERRKEQQQNQQRTKRWLRAVERAKSKSKYVFVSRMLHFLSLSLPLSLSLTLFCSYNNNDWSLWSFACVFFLSAQNSLTQAHGDFTLLFPGRASTCLLSQSVYICTEHTHTHTAHILIPNSPTQNIWKRMEQAVKQRTFIYHWIDFSICTTNDSDSDLVMPPAW